MNASTAEHVFQNATVDAIFADTDVPDDEEEWIDRNADESIDAEIAEGESPVLAD